MYRRQNPDSTTPPDIVTIRGRVDAVKHRNEDTGFSVLIVVDSIRNKSHTCVGIIGPVQPGQTANIQGQIRNHPTFGPQLKIKGATVTAPETAKDTITYLSSGLIKGIGPETARHIVATFGADTLNIINNQPDLLRTVPTVGKKRAAMIIDAWEIHRDVSAIMQFLSERNIGTQRAFAIYRAYTDTPGGAFRVMSENPYQLIRDIRGIGFSIADQIASTLDISADDPRRLRAGVNHVLETETSKGNCGLPLTQFLESATKLLNAPRITVEQIIRGEIAANRIITDKIGATWCAFTRRMHEAEGVIAERLKHLTTTSVPWTVRNITQDIADAEHAAGRTLSDSQRNAISTAVANKVSIITGGPGVGKTTTLDTLLKVLSRYVRPHQFQLAAPTGRAAKRMSEQTSRPAMTVHRLIGTSSQSDDNAETQNENRQQKDDPLDNCKLLVLDESSMLDVRLLQQLLDRLYYGRTKNSGLEPRKPKQHMPAIIFLGDVDQIPSVGAGAVLRDLIDSDVIPVARLTQIFRQAESSKIITNAHRINSGIMPRNEDDRNTDFWLWPFNKPRTSDGPDVTLTQSLAREVVDLAARRMPAKFNLKPDTDIQILAPMRRGDLGTIALNKAMQTAINPLKHGAPSIVWNDWRFQTNDKVMQTTNNYDKEVFNGDQGFVDAIDLEKKQLTVRFDHANVVYEFTELDELMAAYAITIHKSQGSEYPVVIVPIASAHYVMLARNLVYTAVTRGKTMVVLIGQTSAIHHAVTNNQSNMRWTRLRQLLEDPAFRTYQSTPEDPLPSPYVQPAHEKAAL